LAASLIGLTALTAWGAEDYQTRSKRFEQLHAERRQAVQDYCAERKLSLMHCVMELHKEGHCSDEGMTEAKWLSETCQYQGTCCVPPRKGEP